MTAEEVEAKKQEWLEKYGTTDRRVTFNLPQESKKA
jgi:hypothetical protein